MNNCEECRGSGRKYLSDGVFSDCDCLENTVDLWKIRFGKYKNKTFYEIPLEYLNYLRVSGAYDNPKFKSNNKLMKKYIEIKNIKEDKNLSEKKLKNKYREIDEMKTRSLVRKSIYKLPY